MTQSARWQRVLLAVTLMAGLAVRAASAQVAYPVGMFLTISNGGVTRDYLVELRPDR